MGTSSAWFLIEGQPGGGQSVSSIGNEIEYDSKRGGSRLVEMLNHLLMCKGRVNFFSEGFL